jgi:uncharacterized protein YdcH (DUF465 family)
MRIIKTSLIEGLEHTQNKKDFIREITSRIFLICENSTLFKSQKERILQISEIQRKLKDKSDRFSKILEKADKVKKDIVKKEEELDSYNSNLKERLLKMLGSEL